MPQSTLCDQWWREVAARSDAGVSGIEQSGVASFLWTNGNLDSSDGVDLRGRRKAGIDREPDWEHTGVRVGQAYQAAAGRRSGRTLHRWSGSWARLQGTRG